MVPEVLYFVAYVCVLDEKIYDESYFKMINLLKKENLSDDVLNELLKILGDDENKISLDVILSNLKTAKNEDKDTALALGLDIAFADDYWSEDEDTFFKRACSEIDYPRSKFDELFNTIKDIADKEVQKDVESSKKIYGKLFFQLMSKIAPGSLKEQFNQRYINCLLSGTDYSEAIKLMRKISNEDIVYAKTALEKVSSLMTEFLTNLLFSEKKVKTLSEKLHKSADNQDIEKCLDGIKNQVSDFVKETQKQVLISLREKEIAAKYYTISFMGRTKAGKSTLHSVILGGINKEFIGVGKERTTRFNRIYKWNGIRIIDTPGIGAPGGKTDTEIAKSVVDESDLICYVVTSDSIQETEFAFLKELKNQNKPIIILLNKKENLSHPIHKKRFLENPLYWYERTDNDALEGHLIRIKEYAEKYYNNSYFDIYPVQLMAAQLSIHEEDKDIKKKFYKGSRIQQFLDGLRIQILDNGKIKRSQTMLNGTIYSLGNYKSILDSQIKELNAIKTTLEKQSNSSIEKIKKAGKEIKSSLKKGLESTYDNFIQTDIRTFANEYYDTKHDLLDTRWKKFYKQTGFECRIKDRIEREIENYKTKVEEIVQEFSENLTFAFDTLDIKFDLRSTFDTKKLISVTGSIVGFAGAICLAIPGLQVLGGILLGVGILGNLLSGLFKSKDKKIKEAQDKLYESIRNSFEENMDSSITDVIRNFSKATDRTEKQIENLFTILITELDRLIKEMEPLKKLCENYESNLNKLYALRVLNFAKGKDMFDINDSSLLSHLKVKHDFAKRLSIKTDLVKQIDSEKLKHILQEDIVLEAL
ncbi:MAG: GTPase [Candidatus Treponema excrementipullorum]|nr:50S ribosome-binding GTPase [Spirochaetia bacterium]MDY4464954.1 GTPase [Candidatus Treponema excrementipullorum]